MLLLLRRFFDSTSSWSFFFEKGGNDLPRELASATSWAGPKNVLGFWLLLPGEGKEWGVSRDRPVKNGWKNSTKHYSRGKKQFARCGIRTRETATSSALEADALDRSANRARSSKTSRVKNLAANWASPKLANELGRILFSPARKNI